MKKISGILAIAVVLVALLSINLAFAEEGEASVSINPVISVNDSIEEYVPSGFRFGWEKFKLNFVRNETLKAEKELELARWKIAEAKMAAKNGNVEKAEKAMEQHDAILERVQDRISRMDNKSLTPGLDQAILVHEERLANLNLVLESVNLTDEQRAKIEMRISKIENNTARLEEVRNNVSERRQEKLDAFENRTERIEEKGEKVQERMQERADRIANLSNSTDSGSSEESSSNSTNSTN